jgi:NAD(P)-dependent dehydrogenase (short-subunit alcohol dehydrogenase family)
VSKSRAGEERAGEPGSHQPRTALVTGAGSGIGRATAKMLAERGYALMLAGRTLRKLGETSDLCAALAPGANVHVRACDMADGHQARELVRHAIACFRGATPSAAPNATSGLHAIVNCAGEAPMLPIECTDAAVIERTFRTNTFGPIEVICLAWPHLLAQGHGCIVNVSTYGTIDPFPGFLAYAASKSALDSVTRSCHAEGKAHGIRAFTINPGAVETPLLRTLFSASDLPTERTLHPDDVARVVLDCIEGRRDADCGKVIPVLKS